MAGKPKYLTEEDRLAARQETYRKYQASPKGKANAIRKAHSPAGKAAAIRYRAGAAYRSRMQSAQVREYIKNYKAKAREAAPERFQARAAVKYALKKGRIVRPMTCSRCHDVRRIEAHHHKGWDREHWLDIEWLCTPCHRSIH